MSTSAEQRAPGLAEMTVTIQLSDEKAATLRTEAAQHGLTVDTRLERMAEDYTLYVRTYGRLIRIGCQSGK